MEKKSSGDALTTGSGGAAKDTGIKDPTATPFGAD